MPRHHISDVRVQDAVGRLVDQFIRLGSVNALAEGLSGALGGSGRLYPNRLHSLLSEDSARSVNSATLDAVERGLAALEANGGSGDDTVRHRVAAALASVPSGLADPAGYVSTSTGIPLAVVRRITDLALPTAGAHPAPGPVAADWSWQSQAVSAALNSLRRRRGFKAGLVVPTGGGKTRIALRTALEWLSTQDAEMPLVLWVTHRRRLHLQARRALQKLLRDGGVPEGASSIFSKQIQFVMIGELSDAMSAAGDRLSLVIVDEAHHAAAPSYEPVLTDRATPGLFLTATPNRADALPIGIDEITYTITYRELFERGCLVRPRFEPPLEIHGLDWSSAEGLRDLADYLLDRTEADFGKVLVTVSLRERAEVLHEAVVSLLDGKPDHPLLSDDVGFAHAARSSGSGVSPADFLDEFTARPKGVLIATSQLVGEGYDDPSIDAVVVTYPSTSIGHLMQVAGRALRSAPGKTTAHVVQVRESPMEYHFDQRWLYQDISDQLRPALLDRAHKTAAELQGQIRSVLEQHRVSSQVVDRITKQAVDADPVAPLSLMLTGVPYFAAANEFEEASEWGALLVTPEERERFVSVFNDVSGRTDDINEHHAYLARYLPPDSRPGSLWKSYVDLVTAMEYARREISGTPYAGQQNRPFRRGRSTSWLRYVTFNFEASVPDELNEFLATAINRDAVLADYLAAPSAWSAVTKVELPLAGTFAHLLTDADVTWLDAQRVELARELSAAEPMAAFGVLADWAVRLRSVPVPPVIVMEMRQLTRPERFADQFLALSADSTTQYGGVGEE